MKRLLQCTLLLLLLFVTLALRPMPAADFENSSRVEAQVERIAASGGPGDLHFYLKHDTRCFYINRGLDKGLVVDQLQRLLEAERVTFYLADHWTPLDPFGQIRHINRIEFNGRVIYDEMQPISGYQEI